MADFEIQNGTGTGDKMKVDTDNRAHIQSLSIPYEDFSVLNGDSFALLPPSVTLTSTTVSYLLYVSNDNTHDMVISNLVVNMGQSTGGTITDWLFTIHINPTGGTLISAGTPTIGINNNLGSAKTLGITAFTGVEGSTATGGIPVSQLLTGPQNFSLTQKFVIPVGTSFALGLTPPPGNTTVNASIGLTLIKQVLDIE